MDRLIKHWICAHTIYLEDRSNLSNEIFFSYEHMIHSPENVIRSIEKFIDIKIPYKSQFTNQNKQYFKKWKSIFFLQQNRYHEKNQIIEDYESIINNFGYSLVELSKYPDRISCKP